MRWNIDCNNSTIFYPSRTWTPHKWIFYIFPYVLQISYLPFSKLTFAHWTVNTRGEALSISADTEKHDSTQPCFPPYNNATISANRHQQILATTFCDAIKHTSVLALPNCDSWGLRDLGDWWRPWAIQTKRLHDAISRCFSNNILWRSKMHLWLYQAEDNLWDWRCLWTFWDNQIGGVLGAPLHCASHRLAWVKPLPYQQTEA